MKILVPYGAGFIDTAVVRHQINDTENQVMKSDEPNYVVII